MVGAALAPVLAVVSTQIAFFGHDAGHRQITRPRGASQALGLLSDNLLNGLNYTRWLDKHNAHHAHPNDLASDPDVHAGILVFDGTQATGRAGVAVWLTRHQAWLFFPLLTLEAMNLHVSSARALVRPGARHRGLDAMLLVVHLAAYVTLLAIALTWQQAVVFVVGTDERPAYDPAHPLGCHRHRVDDRVVFDCLVAALVHGSGYERVAVPGCSDRTIRRRLRDWAERGGTKEPLRTALAGYDRMLGLELDDLSVDWSITKSPCGGEVSGRSPVDRGKQGTKRSVVTDAGGLPLHLVVAAANAHDSPLLEPTLAGVPDAVGPLPDVACVHLDAGYDSTKTRDRLHILGYQHQIATKANLHRSRSANAGSWNALTPGWTATASSVAAPTSNEPSWSSSSSSSPRSP